MNFILAIIITFILALIFMIILAFVVKLTGELVFGDVVKNNWDVFAGSALVASAVIAAGAVIGGKSDVTIIN